MDLQLKNKVALITGGESGMGKAYALCFAEEGAKVAIIDNKIINGDSETVREIVKKGGKAIAFQADVTNRKQVDEAIDKIITEYGTIDILINNAGARFIAPVDEITQEEWEKQIAVTLTGVFNCSQPVIRIMKKNRYGKIVNISSLGAFRGHPLGAAHYGAGKAGVVGFTYACAKELAPFGINVNCIAPNTIQTPFIDIISQEDKEKIKSNIPLGRLGNPEDLVGIVLLLSSDKASFITGQTICVDGGASVA
jgi:3-oxoacyl-[acyl-carrier protein] reductase